MINELGLPEEVPRPYRPECGWCHEDGYFDDFAPGLYPLPCPNCAGTGLEGIVSKETSKKVEAMRDEMYTRIRGQTERLVVASEAYRCLLLLSLAGQGATLDEPRVALEERSNALQVRLLSEFPKDYLPVERECIREAWARVKERVPEAHRHRVVRNSKVVVGKSLREVDITERTAHEVRQACGIL